MFKHRSKMAILTYGSTAILLFFFGYIIGSRSSASSPLPQYEQGGTVSAKSSVVNLNYIPGIPGKDVWIAEESFETTMRSCLGSFCFDDAVKADPHKEVVRVGLLIPDNIGSETLIAMMRAAGLKIGDNLELIYTSNVPPYGYGKNHGWSRIIRIANHIIPHSIRLLVTTPSTSDISSIQKLVLSQVTILSVIFAYMYRIVMFLCLVLSMQVRQLMRWHCRLSHVAAHTALLTGKKLSLYFI